MKLLREIVIGLVVATVYLNIGYTIATKVSEIKIRGESRTFFEKVLTVNNKLPNCSILNGCLIKDAKTEIVRLHKGAFFSLNIIWPLYFIFIGISWVVMGGYWLFYYIALGGIAKLIGLV